MRVVVSTLGFLHHATLSLGDRPAVVGEGEIVFAAVEDLALPERWGWSR
jgi:hypothetical protein